MLGSNDLLQRPVPTAETCAERIKRFLTMLLEEVSAICKILLIALPPMKLDAWVKDAETLEESHRLAGCYETLARKLGISFADEGAGMWNLPLMVFTLVRQGIELLLMGYRKFWKGSCCLRQMGVVNDGGIYVAKLR